MGHIRPITLIQGSTSYESNSCFSKLSEKLPEMTKKFWDKTLEILSANLFGIDPANLSIKRCFTEV